MGFTTVPEALRAAGKSAGDAVAALGGADCGSPVADVAGALPGSTAAGAASAFANSWKTAFAGWCDEAGQHAAALAKAADTYVAAEHAAQESLPGDGKLRGPR
jgi:hypothetical protein